MAERLLVILYDIVKTMNNDVHSFEFNARDHQTELIVAPLMYYISFFDAIFNLYQLQLLCEHEHWYGKISIAHVYNVDIGSENRMRKALNKNPLVKEKPYLEIAMIKMQYMRHLISDD